MDKINKSWNSDFKQCLQAPQNFQKKLWWSSCKSSIYICMPFSVIPESFEIPGDPVMTISSQPILYCHVPAAQSFSCGPTQLTPINGQTVYRLIVILQLLPGLCTETIFQIWLLYVYILPSSQARRMKICLQHFTHITSTETLFQYCCELVPDIEIA